MPIPKMELVVEPLVFTPGEPVTVNWQAEADEVVLWHSSTAPLNSEPENWTNIEHRGNKVDKNGTIEIALEQTTTIYLVARTARGFHGLKAITELFVEKQKKEPTTWSPQANIYL